MPAAPELPGGTVTFLFTDIEGSTRLLEQRGRERYGELLARHNELLRSAFASNDGIEVDRNGDAFFAVFRSAGAAVRAAADAQRALAAEHWPAGAPVRVRMGLHTGEASVGEGGYVGFAIHLAAHVGAAARGGQTLLTSTVAKIVEHELPTGGRLRDLGERSLKRLERPERLYALELADLPHTVSPDPTPARVDGRRAAPLLERDADLAALRALLDAARGGNGTLAVIEGSAGIGKTRLLGETRAIGAQMGLRVLSARGGELEREFAFGLGPGGLGTDSIAILARDVFAAEPDAEFGAACEAATGGNPLYLRALLVTLAADGLAPTAEASARVEEVGPEPVARAVSLRLSRLPPEATALAQAVAVLGQGAELGLAVALAGLERPAAGVASAGLARAELLRDQDLEFTHPVVRAAIYETMGAVERAEAHRHAAGLLAEAGAEPEQTASHLLLVPPAGDPFVAPVLRQAAAHVLGRGSTHEAAAYLRRALAEPPLATERGDVLTELGEVERGVDVPAAVEHLREAFRLAEGTGRFAAVALECGRVLGYTGFNNAEAIEALRAAVVHAGAEHPDLREQATADLINAAWTEPEFYPTAKGLLGDVQEEDLAGGLGSDMLCATLAHYEHRLGRDRARTTALAQRALASGLLENHSSQELYMALDALRAAGEVELGS